MWQKPPPPELKQLLLPKLQQPAELGLQQEETGGGQGAGHLGGHLGGHFGGHWEGTGHAAGFAGRTCQQKLNEAERKYRIFKFN